MKRHASLLFFSLPHPAKNILHAAFFPQSDIQPYKLPDMVRRRAQFPTPQTLYLCPTCIRRALIFPGLNFSNATTTTLHGMTALAFLTYRRRLSESCMVCEGPPYSVFE